MKRKEENISFIFAKRLSKESRDQQSQAQSNNPTPSSIPSSQDEVKESETTSTFKTITPINEGRLTSIDVLNLPQDPGKRRRMSQFHPSDRDIVRREYCSRDLCQPYKHEFKFTKFGTKNRRFNPKWFDKYKTWLEYSVEKDAAFCFACYLFKDDNVGQDTFVMDGFRNWKKPDSFDVHVGANMSAHRIAMKRLEDFKNQNSSISVALFEQVEGIKIKHQRGLEASVKCLRWLILQDMPFWGHDEEQESLNTNNFIELLKFHAEGRPDIEDVVLENVSKNCQMTALSIQKDIINACAKETIKAIVEEIGDECFAIIADESVDISGKEELSVCLRYVSKSGAVLERFLGTVHVLNSTSLTIKNAILSLLMEHSLTLSKVRGQAYDGASNMQGSIDGLKTLILNECSSAHYVHCFSHQLHLTLVETSKKNGECRWLFDEVLPLLLNFVGGSPKRKEFLHAKQLARIVKALSLGELETGSDLNQELSLIRPGDFRWSTHFKCIKNVLGLFRPILESLEAIADDHEADRTKAYSIIGMLMSFDFIFTAHLMGSIFGLTNSLNVSLQKEDIVHAMTLVDQTKMELQELRDNGWEDHLNKVISFTAEYDCDIPNMEEFYASHVGGGRRMVRGKAPRVTNLHHYRVEVFLSVIDLHLHELENRFSVKTKDLLMCMACFSPSDGFSSFDTKKLLNLAKFYPNEFPNEDLLFFEESLKSFIGDVRNDERFLDVKTLNELSIKLVETRKHENHFDVYKLLKLVLLLPVTTASDERTFSGIHHIKSKVRNCMGEQLLNDSLVTFLEKDLFLNVSIDAIVQRFQNMQTR
ncbi:uncharacterized protein LOC130796782 [Amaranthus tricolor]|uniref:uncharacterized protein LOC130796782 n=1 Tax=Amaranthus tricolor TaxID=29722 RepID=UPI0025861D9A|nr:uncharacterized protein LOC130796782 [Amaranthus tricolor]